ncbi:MAG: hypothetical protein IIC90_01205 [Chloroflexi bacterium]|nr:hypothetical protein [Chloroflexota bacterium]
MELALLLGAGFSKWSVDLPVAPQLFDFEVKPWGVRENQRLSTLRSLKQQWDRSRPGGLAEQFAADLLDSSTQDRQLLLWYLARRLSEPFIWEEFHAGRWRRHVLMIDEKRATSQPGVVSARDFLRRFPQSLMQGIITPNYDMVIEYALGTKGFHYGVPGQRLTGRGPYPVSTWRNPVRLTGPTPLAKIHGSISWDESERYTDGRRGLTGNALIVAPTPEKAVPHSLKDVWNLAERILLNAKGLVVFGFAFNPYDEALLSLLRVAKDIELVLLIDIQDNTQAAHVVWPHATISWAKPPPAGDSTIYNWQNACVRT